MGELDKAFHLVASATENIHWHDFREAGLDEPYYDYYYAEDELYIIRDRVYLRLWFCKARNPKEAWQKITEGVKIRYAKVGEGKAGSEVKKSGGRAKKSVQRKRIP